MLAFFPVKIRFFSFPSMIFRNNQIAGWKSAVASKSDATSAVDEETSPRSHPHKNPLCSIGSSNALQMLLPRNKKGRTHTLGNYYMTDSSELTNFSLFLSLSFPPSLSFPLYSYSMHHLHTPLPFSF